jgi:hypothetical protein
VGFVFQAASGRYYAGIAQRGGDSFFGVVYYSFNTIPDQSGTWTASGNFYVYGLECRLATLLSDQGILLPPMERIEYVEGPRVACTGGNGGTGFQTASYSGFDPYSDSECGDGGSPEGGISNCAQEWIVIQRSDDGGKTWYTIWEGYGAVCQ